MFHPPLPRAGRATMAMPVLLAGMLVLAGLSACERTAPVPLPNPTNRTAAVVTGSGDTLVLDCDDDMPLSTFPADVLDALDAAFPDHTIHEAKRCTSSSGTWFWFELYPLDPSAEDIKVAVDAAGAWYPVIDLDEDGSGSGSGGYHDGFVVTTSGATVAIACSDDGAMAILPASIEAAVNAACPGWTIEESKTCDADGSGPYYVVEVRLSEDLKTAFDAAGNELVYFRD